ncbi:T9SS-dependent choice-of-anchor J family protein [Lewinella sp. 4G2]|uniref:T9SS-dependent choice-of-anchor J family protein n=1 Tax=Lewinella sp. 4G2 TaxID=1803372 RepID=UPI0007B4D25A|nr:choice-of-anchor J domain-containing protein [Lewinella sp. 4G2]OAV44061.1 hypothetical protein A3850_005920 [Lewinella sp. 4G2]
MGQTQQISEDFGQGVPPSGWSIENPDGSEGWEMTTTTQSDGTNGRVARMDNYSYNAPGQEDRLITPALQLTRVLAPTLVFDVAYAPFSDTQFERLYIDVSIDGGSTFSPTAYDKAGGELATTGNQANGWGPRTAADWRSDTLDLTPYAGETIILRFVQVAGYGNGLFIDNVMTNAPAVPLTSVDEDFEGGVPPADWSVENPDGLEGWEMTTTTQSDGTNGRVARMDNYSYDARGAKDYLILPLLDLSGVANPTMVFDVAYAPFSNSIFERLQIEYSTDGGNNFLPTTYDKAGSELATTGNQTNGWGPQTAEDWRSDTLDLSPYAGPSLVLRFVQTNGYGNGLFINDVLVNSLRALPVELLDFNGERAGKRNTLHWLTDNEEAFSHFEVERSSDGNTWQLLGAVAGAAEGRNAGQYDYVDDDPQSSAYYRLRMVDLDSSFAFSPVVYLEREAAAELRVFPNPNSGSFDLRLPEVSEPLSLALYSAHGTRVSAQKIGAGTQNWLVKETLKPGVYLLIVSTEDGRRWTERVVVR